MIEGFFITFMGVCDGRIIFLSFCVLVPTLELSTENLIFWLLTLGLRLLFYFLIKVDDFRGLIFVKNIYHQIILKRTIPKE